jgi:hypothetical protein
VPRTKTAETLRLIGENGENSSETRNSGDVGYFYVENTTICSDNNFWPRKWRGKMGRFIGEIGENSSDIKKETTSKRINVGYPDFGSTIYLD